MGEFFLFMFHLQNGAIVKQHYQLGHCRKSGPRVGMWAKCGCPGDRLETEWLNSCGYNYQMDVTMLCHLLRRLHVQTVNVVELAMVRESQENLSSNFGQKSFLADGPYENKVVVFPVEKKSKSSLAVSKPKELMLGIKALLKHKKLAHGRRRRFVDLNPPLG